MKIKENKIIMEDLNFFLIFEEISGENFIHKTEETTIKKENNKIIDTEKAHTGKVKII